MALVPYDFDTEYSVEEIDIKSSKQHRTDTHFLKLSVRQQPTYNIVLISFQKYMCEKLCGSRILFRLS